MREKKQWEGRREGTQEAFRRLKSPHPCLQIERQPGPQTELSQLISEKSCAKPSEDLQCWAQPQH